MNINGFIAYSPIYGRNSAGVYCMYKILADIKRFGYDVFFTVEDGKIGPYTEVFGVHNISNADAIRLMTENNFIAIYSEGVPGNPLNAKYVMRWYLNRITDETGQNRKYDDFECVYSYAEQYDRYIRNDIKGRLYLPTIDIDLFRYDKSIDKTDITVYTGKQPFRQGIVDKYDNIIYRFAPSHDEVAKILKRTKVLYSFDCTTILVHEALLAGCNVILIPDGTQDREQIRTNILGDIGISWIGDNAECLDASFVSNAVLDKYDGVIKQYESQLKTMIRNMLINKIDNELR